MNQIAILYFSGYGHTEFQAQAVAQGAQEAGADLSLIRISEEGTITDEQWEKLERASAIIYGSPTYMGAPAWQFKKVADASSKVWASQLWKDKFAGGFTVSASTNGDKLSTLNYFFTFSQQHAQIWVGTGLLASSNKNNSPDDVNWTGSFSGAMAIARADADPHEIAQGDLEMAKQYGKRIAQISERMKG